MAAEKRSISFDPETLRAAERLAANEHGGNLSAVVNEALEHRLKLRALGQLLDDMDREFGPVPEEVKRKVDAEIAQWESRSTPAR